MALIEPMSLHCAKIVFFYHLFLMYVVKTASAKQLIVSPMLFYMQSPRMIQKQVQAYITKKEVSATISYPMDNEIVRHL